MDVLTPEMIELIRDFSVGAVATINDEGNSAVSPKSSFVVVNGEQLAFGDIRSPDTVSNLRARPAVEVTFTDILVGRAVRIAGTARILGTTSDLRGLFEYVWGAPYVKHMRHFVLITVTSAELVTSPAYDVGQTEEELAQINLNKLIQIAEESVPLATRNDMGQPIGRPVAFEAPTGPANEPIEGQFCRVVPLDAEQHGMALHTAYQKAADEGDWTYLPYGPFPTAESFTSWLREVENRTDPMFFTLIDRSSGECSGLASYLDIDPVSASIEVGHVHLAPSLQSTTASTEAMYLLMKKAFDAGYRRYAWKCDELNKPSRAAAARLGFKYEGTFRQATHYKGRNRDTAWYSILDSEWPGIEANIRRWLAPANFDDEGRQRSRLRTYR